MPARPGAWIQPDSEVERERLRARLERLEKTLGILVPDTSNRHQLVRIWSALIRAGVLHDGMTLVRAVDALGEPTDRFHGRVSWYHNPGHRVHVYPDLSAREIDGILTNFRIGKRSGVGMNGADLDCGQVPTRT